MRDALIYLLQSITTQAQDIMAQAAREGAPRGNPHASTMASRMRYCTRMKPPVYHIYKTHKDPQEFVDEVHKILCAMGVDEKVKAELSSYQLKDVAKILYQMWANNQARVDFPIT